MELDGFKNPFSKGRKLAECAMQGNNQSRGKVQEYDPEPQWILPPASKPGRCNSATKQYCQTFEQQANGTCALFYHHQKGHTVLTNDLQPEWEMLAARGRLILFVTKCVYMLGAKTRTSDHLVPVQRNHHISLIIIQLR